jgi:integrase
VDHPCLGECRLDRLSPLRVEGFYSLMVEHGLAASSVVFAHHVLSGALQAAVRRGLVVVNVCKLVDKPSRTTCEVEPLTGAEARRVLEAAQDQRNGVRWTLALGLGLRQGEALGLRWRHVDLEAGTLRVAWQLQQLRWRHGCDDPGNCALGYRPMARASHCPRRHSGGFHLLPPKSARSRRTIVLPGPLVAELAEHRRRQLAERLVMGDGWRGWEAGELVVARPDGLPVSPHQDHLEWKQLLTQAGVRHMVCMWPATPPRRRAAAGPLGPVDLDHPLALCAQEGRQSGAIAAGALQRPDPAAGRPLGGDGEQAGMPGLVGADVQVGTDAAVWVQPSRRRGCRGGCRPR